jgi:hypothetical protein
MLAAAFFIYVGDELALDITTQLKRRSVSKTRKL